MQAKESEEDEVKSKLMPFMSDGTELKSDLELVEFTPTKSPLLSSISIGLK